jgi:hypothetical protein
MLVNETSCGHTKRRAAILLRPNSGVTYRRSGSDWQLALSASLKSTTKYNHGKYLHLASTRFDQLARALGIAL